MFDGTITARGGAARRQWRICRDIGQELLTVATGIVDTRAPHGQTGTWLLDPTNITIATSGSGAIAPSAIDSASSNVSLQASNDIVFASPVGIVAIGVGLTAQAGNSITVQSGAAVTTNGGNIAFSANDPAGPASGHGAILIDAPLSTAGPDPLHEIPVSGGTITLTVNGGSGVLSLGADLTTANGAITIDAPVVVTANVAIDATAGGDTPGASVTLAGTVDASSVAAGEVSSSRRRQRHCHDRAGHRLRDGAWLALCRHR